MTSSHADDMAIWKFAIKNHKKNGKKGIWDAFKKETGSKRATSSLYDRFNSALIPHLPRTKFHTQTKLQILEKYKVPIDEGFLEELRKDAKIELNNNRVVTKYTMKKTCGKNKDLEVDDTEFMKLTSPIVRTTRKFTPEEDGMMWDYLIENLDHYVSGGMFWKELSDHMPRKPPVIAARFADFLAPSLSETDFDIGTKLRVLTKCRIAVDEDYLEILKNHATLKMDEDGCIKAFKLTQDKKRKAPEDHGGSAKRAIQEDGDDLVVDHEVPGTGIPNPEMILTHFKGETHDDVQLQFDMEDDDDLVVHEVIAGTVPHPDFNLGPLKGEYPFGQDNRPEVYENPMEGEAYSFNPKNEFVGPFDNFQWNDDVAHPVQEERSEEDGAGQDSAQGILVGMKEMSEKIMDKMQEVEASMDKKVAQMAEEVSRNVDEKISQAVATIQTMQAESVRTQNLLKSNDVPNMHSFLTEMNGLVSLVARLKPPEMDVQKIQKIQEIQDELASALQKSPENDEQPLPIDSILPWLEVGLRMIAKR